MADKSSNLSLNLPVSTDKFDHDIFLRQNFQTIDTKLKANIVQEFTAIAGQTVFTLSNAYTMGQGEISVEVDGVKQKLGSGYNETTPTSITLLEGLSVGAKVKITIIGLSPGDDSRIDQINTQLGSVNNTLVTMRDPLAYLNSVQILCSFSARGNTTSAWIQGFSINEAKNEIYLAIQENNGTYLTIEKRNLDGTFKESKTLTIASGAFTEGLPFFYNGINQLCFIVRTQATSTYVVYNYDLGLLSAPVAINGTPYKSTVEGNYFITCDATSSAPYSINTVYVYDFASIQSGTPTLLNSFKLSKMTTASIEKVQGIVINNGYLFLIQGESNGNPVITAYNTAGQLVSSYPYTKESLATAINTFSAGTITDISNYTYENEGGCKYKGKLVVAHILNSVVYLTIHNSPTGTALETKMPIYRVDTDWDYNITLLNSAVTYASDTTPRIRRIGNQIMLDGAIKGFTTLNQEFLDFGTQYAPDRNISVTQVTTGGFQCNWQIQPNGRARILNSKNTPLATTDWYPFHITWFI